MTAVAESVTAVALKQKKVVYSGGVSFTRTNFRSTMKHPLGTHFHEAERFFVLFMENEADDEWAIYFVTALRVASNHNLIPYALGQFRRRYEEVLCAPQVGSGDVLGQRRLQKLAELLAPKAIRDRVICGGKI